MDQLRKAMAWLKRQHFWVLSMLIAIIPLGLWYSSSGALDTEFVKSKDTIVGEFKSVKSFREKPFLPNETIYGKQAEQNAKLTKNVEAVWKSLWDRQRESVLKWPDVLSKSFRDYIVKQPFGADIPRTHLVTYQNYIADHFDELPKKIKAPIDLASDVGGGMMRGREFMEPALGADGAEVDALSEDDYLCVWMDQGNVRAQLDFPTSPTSLRVWWTQENLWVYHTLLNVIAKTNEAAGADRRSNAAVRTIYALEVGQPAAQASRVPDRIERRQLFAAAADPALVAEGGGGDMSMDMGMGSRSFSRGELDMGMGGRMGGELGGTGMSPEEEQTLLMAGRYLDEQGQPIGGGAAEVAADGTTEATPAAGPDPNAPFKRLPIRMKLQINQRWLSHLISECASQPLQIEVTEVRINTPDLSGLEDGGVGMGGGGFRGGGMRGIFDERGMGGRGGGGLGGFGRGGGGGGGTLGGTGLTPRTPGELTTFKLNPSLVNIEILGIIYIFNKPNSSALQQPEQMAAITE